MGTYSYNEQDPNIGMKLRFLPLICELNIIGLKQFHSSWIDSLEEGDDLKALSEIPEANKGVSKFIINRYRLSQSWICDFTDKRLRVLLIYNQSLNRIIFYLGLIIISPYIRKVIDGQEIKSLKMAIGDEEFEFVRKKAAFYNPGYIGRVVKVDVANIGAANISEEIIKKGMTCLGILFSEDAKHVRSRLAIKCPKEHARLIVSDAFDKAPKEKMDGLRDSIFKILLKLIKEIEPSWQTIFV